MTQFKYLGEGHTLVEVVKGEPKQKVREGEIIESEIDAKYFLKNRFEVVEGKVKVKVEDDGKDDITITTKAKSKK